MESKREMYPQIVQALDDELDNFDYFLHKIKKFFESRKLKSDVHSIRFRLKDIDHILSKVERKNIEDDAKDPEERKGHIDHENIFTRITDIAGVRILHLHFSQFKNIHNALMQKIDEGEFVLVEDPKAYTWDPDSQAYFQTECRITPEIKSSYYTSIHYVLKPNTNSKAICEVQIRTLLEEVWGEVDHAMNYPIEHPDPYCKEEIKHLARLIGTGTHMADSIMRRYKRDD